MRDYASMTKQLTSARRYQPCTDCALEKQCEGMCVFGKAADAIEELLAKVESSENRHVVESEMIDEMYAENERLKNKVPTWISVEERLPETRVALLGQRSKKVIVAFHYDDGTHGTDTAHISNEKWVFEDGIYVVKRTVTHWMQLPEPPKGDAE